MAACAPEPQQQRLVITGAEPTWSNGRVTVDLRQQPALSPEAREALVRGVPLTFELELQLRESNNQTRVASETRGYEIRYLPLSERYQLSMPGVGDSKTYPRLRHVLAELSRLEVEFGTGLLPAGEYDLMARIYLDRSRMPPPMRLPALFSSGWSHASAWYSWPLEVAPGA
jgi:hypothetical protein